MPSTRIEVITSEISDLASSTFIKLMQLWKELYKVNDDLLNSRQEQFLHHTKWFFDDMLHSQELKKEELLKELESKLAEKVSLEKHLSVTIEYTYPENEPLSSVLSLMDDKLKEYREIREQRLSKIKELKEREGLLCEQLTISPLNLVFEIPSEHDMEQYEEQIFRLEEEKIRRTETLIKAKERIVSISNELEVSAMTTLEVEIINSTPDTFCLTSDNMERVKNVLEILEGDLERAHEKANALLQRLKVLWGQIKADEDYRTDFLKRHTSVGKSTVEKIIQEIATCEEIKKANIKPVIECVRKEINDMWDKMAYSEEQRRESLPSFFVDVYSEDILDLHEIALSNLQIFFNENKKLFELAKKRDQLWQKMLHLDDAAQNKDRLYNRGGQLLKEEKERKMLEVNVPKITKELESVLLEFEEKHNKPFLYNGHYLLDKMRKDWEERICMRESKKLARKLENAKTLGIESKVGSRAPQKRKLPETPKSDHHMTRTPLKTTRYDKSRPTTPCNASLASIASYSHFQEEIEEKSRVMTTPKSCRALKCLNTPGRIVAHSSPTKTPPSKRMRTPKPMTEERRRGVRTPKSVTPSAARTLRKLGTPGGTISSPSPYRGRRPLFSALTPLVNKSSLHF